MEEENKKALSADKVTHLSILPHFFFFFFFLLGEKYFII